MNRDIGRFVAPLLAVAVAAFLVAQTLHALHDSGVWRFGPRPAFVPAPDPLAELDGLIARVRGATFAGASRDPFGYGAVVPQPGDARPIVRRPVVPAPPAKPVLTAIIFDSDPRALVRWEGKEYTVRPGGLFDVFEVAGISRDEVTLRRGPESIVLRRKPQGD